MSGVFLWAAGFGVGVSAFADHMGWGFRIGMFLLAQICALCAGLVSPRMFVEAWDGSAKGLTGAGAPSEGK